MDKCQHKIQHTFQGLGKTYRSPCGKESKFVDEHGRNLCAKHFYKWFKKKYKKDYIDEIIDEKREEASN